MEKGYLVHWRRLGLVDKAFFILLATYVILRVTGLSPTALWMDGLVAFIFGLAAFFKLARRAMRQAIWRLRNRLIVAYLFIAVVPVVLILALVGIAGWVVIGQMAVYLVNTELSHRESSLVRQTEMLLRVPTRDPEAAINRVKMMTHSAFPDFELRATGRDDLRYPPDSRLAAPPIEWKDAWGLIARTTGGKTTLHAWAHSRNNESEVTILAPITHELLADLVPKLGDVTFMPVMGHIRTSHVPPPVNMFDFALTFGYPVDVPAWESPQNVQQVFLVVSTRLSAVFSILFGQKMNWGEGVLAAMLLVTVLFLIVELVALVAGVQLSRSITGAVHELYEATLRVKEGDFSFRIPVKSNDQLAELGHSFNTMTENLGRLIVVAKEKERLESELAIAREVQDQLFPKDVPYTKTLELKGVCNPARMVSGDYYDFMALPGLGLGFAIGDVAGKGISAALLMATIQSTMRTQLSAANGAAPLHYSTALLVSNLNRQLYANTAPEKYATFYFALYEEATSLLTYTNAGHLAPILLRGSTMSTLDSTGTVVGAFPVVRYEEKSVSLRAGDLLVAYTDGIIEPENAYGEMYGEDRLKDLVVKYASADSTEIIARTMEAVAQWTGSLELQDDMTMVVARRI